MIGFVFALPQELESFRVKLGPSARLRAEGFTFYYSCVNAQPVVLVKSGIGRERSRRAAESLLKIFRVNAVISAGLAGGVKDGLHTGDLIIAKNVLDYSQRGKPGSAYAGYACHQGLVNLSCKLVQEKGIKFRCGDLLTVTDVAAQPASKRRIGDTTSAVAVDMESTGVAETAKASGTPFLALRVLSDEIDDELKGCDLIDEEGRVKTLRVVSHLLSNPLDLRYLFRLHHKTNEALANLALFLHYFVQRYGEVSNPLHTLEKQYAQDFVK